MINIYWTKGLPASGKSTWAKKWVNEKPKERIRVNRDDIRHMLGPYWIPSRENLVTNIENAMIVEAVASGYSIVIDATNFRGVSRFEYLEDYNGISLINRDDIKFICKDFTNVSIEECIQRDRDRKQGHVGKHVIIRMYQKYLK